jgi:hypothetical protein
VNAAVITSGRQRAVGRLDHAAHVLLGGYDDVLAVPRPMRQARRRRNVLRHQPIALRRVDHRLEGAQRLARHLPAARLAVRRVATQEIVGELLDPRRAELRQLLAPEHGQHVVQRGQPIGAQGVGLEARGLGPLEPEFAGVGDRDRRRVRRVRALGDLVAGFHDEVVSTLALGKGLEAPLAVLVDVVDHPGGLVPVAGRPAALADGAHAPNPV